MADSSSQRCTNFSDKALLAFFSLTFGLGWGFWMVAMLAEKGIMNSPIPPPILLLTGTFAPSASAFIVAFIQKRQADVRNLARQLLHWRVNPIWYGLVFLGPTVVMLASIGLYIALGNNTPTFPPLIRWPLVLINFIVVFLLGGPVGEEFGWRGFALPHLQRKYSTLVSSCIVGSIWALWHLPLFFIKASPQYTIPFLAFFIQSIAISIIMAWIYNSTKGSLLLVMLLHATINTFAQPLRILPVATGSILPFIFSVAIIAGSAILISLFGMPED
jgi:membrane protease YdiL (CAAX protease family)